MAVNNLHGATPHFQQAAFLNSHCEAIQNGFPIYHQNLRIRVLPGSRPNRRAMIQYESVMWEACSKAEHNMISHNYTPTGVYPGITVPVRSPGDYQDTGCTAAASIDIETKEGKWIAAATCVAENIKNTTVRLLVEITLVKITV